MRPRLYFNLKCMYNRIMEVFEGNVKWIDIVQPKDEEIAWLKEHFNFHPVIIEELKESSARAKVESFGEYLYLVYHSPVYDSVEKVSRRAEIDFLITKNEVITVHYDDIEAYSDFKQSLKNEEFKKNALDNTLKLTRDLLGHLINFNQRELNHIEEKVESVANELFNDEEKKLLEKISYLKRDLSEYQLIVRPQQHLFNSLLENGVNFWGPQSRVYLADLLGEYLKLLNRLDSYREAVADFEATNNQLMNVKTNEIMKTFTILAFSTFPLTLIATIFTMRTGGLPFVDQRGGFWIVLGIMAIVVIAMALFFKRKRWL